MPLGASRAGILGASGTVGDSGLFSFAGDSTIGFAGGLATAAPGTQGAGSNCSPLWSTFSETTFAVSQWVKGFDAGNQMHLLATPVADFLCFDDMGDNTVYTNIEWTGAGSKFVSAIVPGLINNTYHHVYIKVDSTQAVNTNRVILYVDGIQVGNSTAGTAPNLNDTVNLLGYAGLNGWEDAEIAVTHTDNTPDTVHNFQIAVFSGTLPSIGSVYTGASPVSNATIAALPGCFALADCLAGDISHDAVSGQVWLSQYVGNAIASADVPS